MTVSLFISSLKLLNIIITMNDYHNNNSEIKFHVITEDSLCPDKEEDAGNCSEG